MRSCSATLIVIAALTMPVVDAVAQTVTNGSSLALRSTGTVTGGNVQLRSNGYVGTYVTLASAGDVTLAVNAQGQLGGGIAPQMNLVVDDSKTGWSVGATAATYSTTLSLPAGTHFVRLEFANDIPSADRRLTVQNLSVTGASVSNSNSDANALAAADTYIANYRKGNASIALLGVAPGTQVQVQLVNHAFRFGTEVPGGSTAASVNTLLANNPTPGSTAANYQQRLLQNFNSMTPGNSGKWANNEATQNVVTMGGVDRITQFAAANDLRVRQHNLIWGSQQPNYINTLLTNAAADNATAKTNLSNEITQRIQYYVRDRATTYDQLDVYNESVHTTQYWNVYGASGIADIYNQTAQATAAAGANVKLFTNEYNVLADSSSNFVSDPYANWYRSHVESITQAGGNVGGIGIQYYAHEDVGPGNSSHNAARLMGALNNLSVTGLALELTEFGIKDDGAGTDAENRQTDAQIMEETMKLVFGSSNATGFTTWGFWQGDMWDQAPNAYLYDTNWNISPTGQMYQDLFTLDNDADPTDDWTTQLALTVGADGTINFNGFYGDYDVVINGQIYSLSLEKGLTQYTLATGVPEPGGIFLLSAGGFALLRRVRGIRG